METKFDIGDKVYVEFEIKKIGSKAKDSVTYEIESDKVRRVHGWNVGKLLINEEDVVEVPKISITGVSVSEDGGIVTLTATGENIDATAEYNWAISLDGSVTEAQSTGASLVLTDALGAAFIAAEKVTAVISVDDYTSDEIKVKGFEVAITGIDEQKDGENNIVLTVIGNNLDADAEYQWTITCGDTTIGSTSVGIVLTLSVEETAIYEAAEMIKAVVKVGNYASYEIIIKEPSPTSISITSVSVSDDGDNHTVLTAIGENLPETAEYGWTIKFNENEVSTTSTGSALTLTDEQTTLYAASANVKATISVGDYISEEITVKE